MTEAGRANHRDLTNIFSERAPGFHRQAKLF